MVRLLRIAQCVTPTAFANFQSHNGAIAAAPLDVYPFHLVRFQSHNGAIAA